MCTVLSFSLMIIYFFFFNDTATTEIYTLSLHDALPISDLDRFTDLIAVDVAVKFVFVPAIDRIAHHEVVFEEDRKSTRLNSSHSSISYAVFCLKKKKKQTNIQRSNTLYEQ